MTPTPPLTTQIASFGKALVAEAGAIVSGQQPVSAEEHHRRLSICFACSQYTDAGRCRICGCPMERKTGFRAAKCADQADPKW